MTISGREVPDVGDSALPDGAPARSPTQALHILQRNGRQADVLCLIWLLAFQHSLHSEIQLLSNSSKKCNHRLLIAMLWNKAGLCPLTYALHNQGGPSHGLRTTAKAARCGSGVAGLCTCKFRQIYSRTSASAAIDSHKRQKAL